MYNQTQDKNYLDYTKGDRMYPSPSSPKMVYFNNSGNIPPLLETKAQNRFHQQIYHNSFTLPKNTSSDNVPETNVVSPSSPNSLEDEITQKNMQMMFEKKKRRRESHNAVERRRRDNINDRINELATLLPDKRDAVKSNKGTILHKSVENIKRLQNELKRSQDQIRELENTLELHRIRFNQQILLPQDHSIPSLNLSALNYYSPSSTGKNI